MIDASVAFAAIDVRDEGHRVVTELLTEWPGALVRILATNDLGAR